MKKLKQVMWSQILEIPNSSMSRSNIDSSTTVVDSTAGDKTLSADDTTTKSANPEDDTSKADDDAMDDTITKEVIDRFRLRNIEVYYT